MTTYTTIQTVSGMRRHRPVLFTLLTAMAAVALCATLVIGL